MHLRKPNQFRPCWCASPCCGLTCRKKKNAFPRSPCVLCCCCELWDPIWNLNTCPSVLLQVIALHVFTKAPPKKKKKKLCKVVEQKVMFQTTAKVFKNYGGVWSGLLYEKQIVQVKTFWKPLLKSIFPLVKMDSIYSCFLTLIDWQPVQFYHGFTTKKLKVLYPFFMFYKRWSKLKVLKRKF